MGSYNFKELYQLLKNPKRALRFADKRSRKKLIELYHERRGKFRTKYDLTHLTQSESQEVIGPIQDDEALFLYSIVRGMRLSRILEVGGLRGYSAVNFLKALEKSKKAVLYTVDLNKVRKISENHKVITKDIRDLTREDLDNEPIDLIFFDCHNFDAQILAYKRLLRKGLITDRTILALHDTNLHPRKYTESSYKISSGYVHQKAERMMVNYFKKLGYDVFSLHTDMKIHDSKFPFRHGISICSKFQKLRV